MSDAPSLVDQLEAMRPWWWLSFCDATKPEGSQFQGVAVVQGFDLPDAVREAWRRRCNPGGEIQVIGPIPPEFLPGRRWLNRLLTREESLIAGDEEHPEFSDDGLPSPPSGDTAR